MRTLYDKYNVPGPRYTSYPTVPFWDRTPTSQEWIEHLRASAIEGLKSRVGAALYVHIPFCQSLCTYCGCNTRITRNRGVAHPYVDTVLKEWDLYLDALKLGERLLVSEIHLGGGTPTFLDPEELQRLIRGLHSRMEVHPNHEFSVEADPRVTTTAHLEALRELGFKRLSLGIQDFDPKVQDIVHRIQTPEQVRAVVETARRLGFDSVNFDLIYGLPLQNIESIRKTFEIVGGLKPDRIAFYAYAHVPWIKPGQRRFTEADLPQGAEKRALYELGRETLESLSYREVGMDHFALETDSLWKAAQTHELHRNFMGYIAKRVHPLIGLGVSSIGDSGTAFAQNEKLLETYQERVNAGEIPITRGHILDDEDLQIRQLILDLMTKFEATVSDPDAASRLSEFERDGLVQLQSTPQSKTKITVTKLGRGFLRNICMVFDARLARKNAISGPLFSQTV